MKHLVGATANTIEHVSGDDTVKLERQIVAGHDKLISTVGADRAHEAIPRGSGGVGSNAGEKTSARSNGPSRDSSGKFTSRRGT